jgi:hypothetical protein
LMQSLDFGRVSRWSQDTLQTPDDVQIDLLMGASMGTFFFGSVWALQRPTVATLKLSASDFCCLGCRGATLSAILAICAVTANAMPKFWRTLVTFATAIFFARIDAVPFVVLSGYCHRHRSGTMSICRPTSLFTESRSEVRLSVLLHRSKYRRSMSICHSRK